MLTTFGIIRDRSDDDLRELVNVLTVGGYIKKTNNQYQCLTLGEKSGQNTRRRQSVHKGA
ncbi:MAG: RQC domain-containing protein [Eubacterium sp.]